MKQSKGKSHTIVIRVRESKGDKPNCVISVRKPKGENSKTVEPVHEHENESLKTVERILGLKDEHPDESSFLTSVFLKKQEKGKVDPVWIVAALSTWPTAQRLRQHLVSYPIVDNPLLMFAGPLALALPDVALLATHALRAYFKKSDQSHFNEISSRLETALRVFRDLQSIRESDPETYKDEMEHLFDDLVEDRRIVG